MTMKTLPSGLMIHDWSDKSLQDKLADCCTRFKKKFGLWPSTVWLHKDTLGDYVSPDGLKLVTNQYCQPNIFLIGPIP